MDDKVESNCVQVRMRCQQKLHRAAEALGGVVFVLGATLEVSCKSHFAEGTDACLVNRVRKKLLEGRLEACWVVEEAVLEKSRLKVDARKKAREQQAADARVIKKAAAQQEAADATRDAEMCAPLPQTPRAAPRAPRGPQAVDPVELQCAEAAPLSEAAGASRGVSTLVPTPTSLESIATRPTPERDAVINFAPPKRGKGKIPKHCMMCGKEGMDALQAKETAADCVIIPKCNKGVCKGCAKVWWVSNGCYFKFCQGLRNFQEIHAFEGRLGAGKCNAAAKEALDKQRKRTAGKAPGSAKKARKA